VEGALTRVADLFTYAWALVSLIQHVMCPKRTVFETDEQVRFRTNHYARARVSKAVSKGLSQKFPQVMRFGTVMVVSDCVAGWGYAGVGLWMPYSGTSRARAVGETRPAELR
jgi:hypothetical protein